MYRNIKIFWSKKPKFGTSLLATSDLTLDRFELRLDQVIKNKQLIITAEVKIFFKDKKNEEFVKNIQGGADTVYAYILEYNVLDADLFRKAWKVAKEKNIKSLTSIPFQTTKTHEQFYDHVNSFGMNAKKLAELAKKDYANVFRDLRGTTELTLNKAKEYAEILKCDPVDLLFEPMQTQIWGTVNIHKTNDNTPGEIIDCKKEKFTVVPREIYKPNIACFKINSPGSYLHNKKAFYYRTEGKDYAGNNDLVMVGVKDQTMKDLEIDFNRWYFGIYQVELGGREVLYNPDPFAKEKIIVTSDKQPFNYVAPIVLLLDPSSLKKNSEYYEQIKNYAAITNQYKIIQNLRIIAKQLQEAYYNQNRAEEKKLKQLYQQELEDLDEVPNYLKKFIMR